MDQIVSWIKVVGGAVCAGATYLWGGMDAVLIALLALIALDYTTGVLVAAYTGVLSSEIGFRGIIKKVAMLLVVALAHVAGVFIGIPEIRSLVIGFYIANEGISILENVEKTGVPVFEPLKKALEKLKSKDGDEDRKQL